MLKMSQNKGVFSDILFRDVTMGDVKKKNTKKSFVKQVEK